MSHVKRRKRDFTVHDIESRKSRDKAKFLWSHIQHAISAQLLCRDISNRSTNSVSLSLRKLSFAIFTMSIRNLQVSEVVLLIYRVTRERLIISRYRLASGYMWNNHVYEYSNIMKIHVNTSYRHVGWIFSFAIIFLLPGMWHLSRKVVTKKLVFEVDSTLLNCVQLPWFVSDRSAILEIHQIYWNQFNYRYLIS